MYYRKHYDANKTYAGKYHSQFDISLREGPGSSVSRQSSRLDISPRRAKRRRTIFSRILFNRFPVTLYIEPALKQEQYSYTDKSGEKAVNDDQVTHVLLSVLP